MKNYRNLVGLFIIGFVFLLQPVLAQNWTGNVNSDWNNSANWSSWPLDGEDISINPASYTGNAASPVISANSVFSPAGILIENGGILTIEANLTTQDDVEVIGVGSSIVVNNGTFNVNIADGGRFIIDLGATITVNGGNTVIGERFIAGEDVLVTVNGGTLSSGERLILDLGGTLIQHNGTVNVAATFAMADGSLNNNSSYILNDGVLNVTGEFEMEVESGEFEPTFIQNGGTLNVDGNIFWFGVAPGFGTPRFIMNSGDATVSGMIQNMPLSTAHMFFKLDGDANFTFNGGLIEGIYPEDSILQLGNATFILNNTNVINNTGVFHAEDVTTTFNGQTTLSGNGAYQFSTIEIAATAQLNHQSPAIITVSGDVIHEGTFVSNTNGVTLNGVQQQTISGASPVSFYQLTVENTSTVGVLLQTPVEVVNDVLLSVGQLTTDAINILTLLDDATSSEGNEFSFVNGPMRKIGNDAFVFPVGADDLWRRIAMSNPANLTDEFIAEYHHTSFSDIVSINTPLSGVSNIEYWTLDANGIGSTVTVELYWEDAAMSAITDCSELTIANWNGTSWDNVLSTSTGDCTGNGTGYVTSNSAVSEFGAFTFGFYSGVTTQNFTICEGDSIEVGTSIYNTSGSYIDVLTDVDLNDSIVLTNLTVITLNTDIVLTGLSISAEDGTGDEYQWLNCATDMSEISGAINAQFAPPVEGFYAFEISKNGCVDTSLCVYYVVNDTTICGGEELVVGSSTYSTSGVFSDMLTSTNELDSVVITVLNVIVPNVLVTVSGLTIEAVDNTADNYQWMNCASNEIIENEIASVFIATENGSYALIVTDNGCEDTSSCVTINTVALQELEKKESTVVYPNPFISELYISSSPKQSYFSLYDILGNRLIAKQLIKSANILEGISLETGVYFVVIEDDEQGENVFKVIKR